MEGPDEHTATGQNRLAAHRNELETDNDNFAGTASACQVPWVHLWALYFSTELEIETSKQTTQHLDTMSGRLVLTMNLEVDLDLVFSLPDLPEPTTKALLKLSGWA